MNFSMEQWMQSYLRAVENAFGSRVWFVGLQGSYGRGEATGESDIDVVLILDRVSPDDLKAYSRVLDTLPKRDMICGFFSGKEELEHWDKADLFQFCHDTTPFVGSLAPLMETIREEDVRRAILTGACSLYHACVHNALHEKSGELLKELYKAAAFTLQAVAYLQTGVFERKQGALATLLQPEEQEILAQRLRLKNTPIAEADFETLSALLMQWASKWMTEG